MVLLYQGVEQTNNSFSTQGMPPANSCNWETKIASLVECIQEKDKMIALLESALKVNRIFMKNSNLTLPIQQEKAVESTSPCSKYEEKQDHV